ncbi:hypothetical protein C2845_PM09G10610 [Panicum miliaceum]|uniref:Uncharacterized protein n=1 Tax=Panicum miliaceum TaxID=4540 RepID=A0A3L6RXT8_PANMI|nr:hypothetical protein C2845_PM09G10610 [Panicum miliaceum]
MDRWLLAAANAGEAAPHLQLSNVVTANFTSYAGGATGGSGSFAAYAAGTNAL